MRLLRGFGELGLLAHPLYNTSFITLLSHKQLVNISDASTVIALMASASVLYKKPRQPNQFLLTIYDCKPK